MSTTRIDWEVLRDGVLYNATKVTLADPTNSYGVQRKDTLDTVVPAGTILVRTATGKYEYEFTDPVEGLEYRYYIRVEIEDQVFYYERDYSKADAFANIVGRYADSNCMFNKFGYENIIRWATFSDSEDQTTLVARITDAINKADDFVDDSLRYGPYVLPFTSTIPNTIKNIACTIAGVKLYEARGIEDFVVETGAVNRIQTLAVMAERELAQIRSGRLVLEGMTGSPHIDVGEETVESPQL